MRGQRRPGGAGATAGSSPPCESASPHSSRSSWSPALVYLATWTGFLIHHDVYEARFGHGYGDYSAPWGAYVDKPTPGFLGETRDAFRSLWHFHVMTWDFSAHGLDTGRAPSVRVQPARLARARASGRRRVQRRVPALGLRRVRRVVVRARGDDPRQPDHLVVRRARAAGVDRRLDHDPQLALGRPRRGGARQLAAVVRLHRAGRSSPTTPSRSSRSRSSRSPWSCTSSSEPPRLPGTGMSWWLVAGGFMTAVVVAFWFFHPVLTGEIISYDSWHERMWFDRWI